MKTISIYVLRACYMALVFVLATGGTNSLIAQTEQRLNDFEVVLPHVVRGTLGQEIETIIVLSNPIGKTQVTLTSTDPLLLADQVIELDVFETREIRLSGGAFAAGAVIVRTAPKVPLSGMAHTNEIGVASQILIGGHESPSANIAIPSQRLARFATVPVFRKAAGQQPTIADDTGVAIYFVEGGELYLFDQNGEPVAMPRGFKKGERVSAFLSEIFPDLPAAFTNGTLFITSQLARAFAATALYIKQGRIWSAEVTPIDTGFYYNLFLRPGTSYDALKSRYQFGDGGTGQGSWTIVATDEVARALERDPSVAKIEPAPSPVVF